jgi:aspartate/methionine/tyrosine aminotransferase
MRHTSAYLDWYNQIINPRYDLRSSGLAYFKYRLDLGEVDLSLNYSHGNPETARLLALRYDVKPECVFISSEGASGQNARIIRHLAERNRAKNEAIVEYPTYEPLLRQAQEHFVRVKRLKRITGEAYKLDSDELRRLATRRTGLLVLTNPHAPSGAVASRSELKEICDVAGEFDFFVLCDEIYAEFDRKAVPTVFSADPALGIVTTSFTKAYGLGGLKLGTALANKEMVDELYGDVLNTVGNTPNVVQLFATKLLTDGMDSMERHKQKWDQLKRQTEELLKRRELEYYPNRVSVTYWVELPMKDTYRWVNDCALLNYGLAVIPGAFFMFRDGYELAKSKMIRLGLGNVNPDRPNVSEAFEALADAIKT